MTKGGADCGGEPFSDLGTVLARSFFDHVNILSGWALAERGRGVGRGKARKAAVLKLV